MAFTATITKRVLGSDSEARIYGTYVNTGGSTGGDIQTGLSSVNYMQLQPVGVATLATQSVVNETFPVVNDGGNVTIVTSADESGQWMAWGY